MLEIHFLKSINITPALKYLLPQVPKGGIVVFDELNHPDYPGETIALKEMQSISNTNLKRLPFAYMAAYSVIE